MGTAKPVHEYYDFECGFGLKENVFLTKVVQKYRHHASKYENAYAYIPIKDKKKLLGNPTYKKRLDNLLNSGVLQEVAVGINPKNAKQSIWGYIPADIPYKRRKAYLPFLDTYYIDQMKSYSPEALWIYSTMLNSTVDITDFQLKEALVLSCKRNNHLDVDKYLNDNQNMTRERIDDFNSSSHPYLVEDNFGNRTHTFVSSLTQEIRKQYLFINGNPISELDLHQSQMVILGVLLERLYGKNSFSDLVKNEDVYNYFGDRNNIDDRVMAKKMMFRALFDRKGSKADLMFKEAFPDAYGFVKNIKSIYLPQNPSWKWYSNLSFMLQREESGIFNNLWKELRIEGIKFLTVHDSIIVEYQYQEIAKKIMQRSLNEQIGNYIYVN